MPTDEAGADRPRRPVLPVLLAVVFLAMIGGSVGVILGTRHVRGQPGAMVTPAAGPTARPSDPTSPGMSCPASTEQAVLAKTPGAGVKLKLYIETQLSEVWICTAPDGGNWYQGHRKPPSGARYPEDRLIPGVNAVLLPATVLPDGRYQAINGATTYLVSTAELVITSADGKHQQEAVVKHFP